MPSWEIILLFFMVAALYSSVGFGGGSSYLAFLALFGVNYLIVRSTALLCNIVVVTGGVYIFYKNGHLKLRQILPLTLASVPMAFLGGYLPLREHTFFLLLGSTLAIAAFFTWFQPQAKQRPGWLDEQWKNTFPMAAGGGIGLLSGMVGIGGGIFLAPLLYLTRWDLPKTIAATSSFFILVNSIAGLGGQMVKPEFQMDWKFSLPLLVSVFLGGQLGSRMGAVRLPQVWVRRATALLIVYVGIRILRDNF
jgi:hypothetical protein